MTEASKTPETAYDQIESDAKFLNLPLDKDSFAVIADKQHFSEQDISKIRDLFDYIAQLKKESIVETCLKLSRLPKANPKTFENFDFSRLNGPDVDKLKVLSNLAPLYEHQTLAVIGSPGLGKTHLAMAFGHRCCELGIKTYFLTASELNEKLIQARKADRVSSAINGLVKPSCLIIDEIGHCTFDLENTRLFFDIINRRTNKDGPHCLILTSNQTPDTWGSYFQGKETALCTLDRIFDNAIVYMMKGNSYRGQKLQTIAIEAN